MPYDFVFDEPRQFLCHAAKPAEGANMQFVQHGLAPWPS